MGNRYLNSANAGSEISPYDTVAGAASSVAQILALNGGADALVCASEVVYTLDTHNETSVTGGVATTWTSPSTDPKDPARFICVTDLSTPTTLSTGAKLTNSTAHGITVYGSFYFYGFTIEGTDPSIGNTWWLGNYSNGPVSQVYDHCTFNGHNHSSVTFRLQSVSPYGNGEILLSFLNCTYSAGNSGGMLHLTCSGIVSIDNLTLTGTAPTSIFRANTNSQAIVNITNSDLTGVSWTNLVDATASTGTLNKFTLRNVKIPAGINWFKASPTTYSPVLELDAINVDSGDTWTRHERVNERTGVVSVITTVYADTNPALFKASEEYSIKIVSSANVSRFLPLYSQWFCVWNDATAYTPAIEVLVGGAVAALDNDELWLEVDYNSGSDSPLGTRVTTCPGLLETPASVADGTTTWTGDTGWDHKLSTAQITPDKPGFIWMRVALAKASTTIYVNPPRP